MDDKKRNEDRKKRQQKKKGKSVGKTILAIIGILVLGVATFLGTVKICDPSFTISELIPEGKIDQIIGNLIVKETTTLEPETTTMETTTRADNYDYDEFSEFAFDTGLQGNQVGNLLNSSKGAVALNASYSFFSIENDGIYRFEPKEEATAQLRVDGGTYKCLNVLGDYLYYVDTTTHELIRSKTNGNDPTTVSDQIDFAYLYGDKLFFVGVNNTVGFINSDGFEKTVLYTADSNKTVSFVGISLNRVFFTEYEASTAKYEYITVNQNDTEDVRHFRNDTVGDELKNMQFENGFMYYYLKQSDGTYNLIRQKFGSSEQIILVSECKLTHYPCVIDARVYYSYLEDGSVKAMEYNMNNKETKVMLKMGSADSSSTASACYGNSCTFLIGAATESGDVQYRASSIYTSSSADNTIAFYDGAWHY